MQTTPFVLVALLVAACAGTAPQPTPAARAAQPPKPTPSPHELAVDALVGVWAGQAVGTPFGDFPMAIAFDREPSGEVHGRLDGGRGMYLDFRFRREAGTWILVEEGAIPDVGVQTTTLVPTATSGEPRWVDRANPERLAVSLFVTPETLVMTTSLHGETHAVFKLRRARGPAEAQIRQALAGSKL